ncbi:MAG TPA: hypothetical protein VN701_01940 [Candidatus Paceibacterota bacterium]|nr:hypothetical protein [Candidatus Paceibacterota bacterium]
MTAYSSYALSPELKRLACRQAGPSVRAELAFEQAWQDAVSRYDKFFMDSQRRPTTALERVEIRLSLIDKFVSCGVWQDTARRIVDECLFDAALQVA